MRLILCILATLLPAITAQQTPPDDAKFNEIRARYERGEKITKEEQEYAERRNQENASRRFAEYAKSYPPRESTGLVPINDLGTGVHEGEQGGLYPGGQNTPPAAHLRAGLKLSREIVPLDSEGRRSPDGRVVFISIGMSNTTQESRAFLQLISGKPELNPRLVAVDGAQGGQTAAVIAAPNAKYWSHVDAQLREAGVTAKQVRAAWLKEANGMPKEAFPAEAKKLQQDLVKIIHNLHEKMPNLKIVYLSSRIYGGYAASPLNPEPHAYESGFSVKWLIADQIAGNSDLNYDPEKGAVRAPWLAWGPYLWSDGLKARKDGLVWDRRDLGPDGTHPSAAGREKVAHLLFDMLRKEPTARPWFLHE